MVCLKLIVLFARTIAPAMRPGIARRPRTAHEVIDIAPNRWLSGGFLFGIELQGSFSEHLLGYGIISSLDTLSS
jgi:hypothetical protein